MIRLLITAYILALSSIASCRAFLTTSSIRPNDVPLSPLKSKSGSTPLETNDSSSSSSPHPSKPTSLLHRIRSKLLHPPTIRGSHYANTSILTPSDAARAVDVAPTWEASKAVWQTAWRAHRSLLPLLHYRLWDGCEMKDSKLALAVLWWKALAGNDASSPVYDHGLSYDLLPSITRTIVHPAFCRLYPRLHHANVEIRTAYLDKAVASIISTICNQTYNSTATCEPATTANDMSQSTTISSTQAPINIRLIIMGGGYDTRSFKLIEHHLMHSDNPPSELVQQQERRFSIIWSKLFRNKKSNPLNVLPSSERYNLQCYELDLPEVVATKRKLIESRLSRRRPWFKSTTTEMATMSNPILLEADLNNLNQTQSLLEHILSCNSTGNKDESNSPTVNIILFEGVMIYLDKGVPHALLEMCSRVLKQHHSNTTTTINNDGNGSCNYLCFADRLDNIPGGDVELAKAEMKSTGWVLQDWLSKPGLARHMGYADLR
ncbi:hypothetical protein ACHAWO_006415 [Cyclotella atomus]|uniref:Uncharacterized protein n=1 Tax=Cyclotella atomus TaxID=382360 RepID=A0ABD3PHQ0_9STRA